MRPGEVEQWVVKVVEQLERGLRVEDDRVECKRELPDDPARAARRIAGHANQVREDRILWIIGVDEKADDPIVGRGLSEPDAAAWWPPVEAKFDEVAPSPVWVNVPTGDNKSVLGLGFDTSRPPYVLRLGTDNPSREVPWREGTRVRSANRFDLLKLLVPLVDQPMLSLLDGYLQVGEAKRKGEEQTVLRWSGQLDLYIDSRGPITLPNHRCSGRVEFLSGASVILDVTPGAPTASGPLALTAEQGHDQVVLHGPSAFWLDFDAWSPLDDRELLRSSGEVEATLGTAGTASTTLQVRGRLHHDVVRTGSSLVAVWKVRPSE